MEKTDFVPRSARPLAFVVSNMLQHSGAVTAGALAGRVGEPEAALVEILADLVRDKKAELIRSIADTSQDLDYYRWIQPGDRDYRWQRTLLEGCSGQSPLRFEKRLALMAEC